MPPDKRIGVSHQSRYSEVPRVSNRAENEWPDPTTRTESGSASTAAIASAGLHASTILPGSTTAFEAHGITIEPKYGPRETDRSTMGGPENPGFANVHVMNVATQSTATATVPHSTTGVDRSLSGALKYTMSGTMIKSPSTPMPRATWSPTAVAPTASGAYSS